VSRKNDAKCKRLPFQLSGFFPRGYHLLMSGRDASSYHLLPARRPENTTSKQERQTSRCLSVQTLVMLKLKVHCFDLLLIFCWLCSKFVVVCLWSLLSTDLCRIKRCFHTRCALRCELKWKRRLSVGDCSNSVRLSVCLSIYLLSVFIAQTTDAFALQYKKVQTFNTRTDSKQTTVL